MDDWTAAETQAWIDAFKDEKHQLSGRLSVSTSAEHLHLAAVLENDPESAERLVVSNPTVFTAYLAAIRMHGETVARTYLVEETARQLQERPELACEP